MNDVQRIFENWFKDEYRWEMKRGVNLLGKTESGQYLQQKTQDQFKAFTAAIKIMGEIK